MRNYDDDDWDNDDEYIWEDEDDDWDEDDECPPVKETYYSDYPEYYDDYDNLEDYYDQHDN